MSDHNFLSNLNEQQYKAVVSPASSLQILAGPGSGKTRVLTTRAAWLVLEKKIDPERIMVVTFTNKAARDMKEKLEQPTLLGKRVSSQLKMGTFHSICACIVRRYYSFVGLKSNFTIVEPATCIRIISKLQKELKAQLSEFAQDAKKAGYFYSEISKAKNQGLKCAEFAATRGKEFKYRDIAVLYSAYEERLLSQNLVDFDNLLLYGRDLFRYVTELENFVGHVLVDEFQDTNVVQYDLVCLLTQKGQSLTIVGDPDQAIFGWRYADVTNFIKMRSDFPQTEIVNLERNYRSTSSILNSALHVVSYDKDRIEKALFTTNAEGVQTSLLSTSSAETEAGTVAEEILRIVKYSNGLISYKDIAVLVRMNFMSRNLEQAFAALSLPHIVLGGLRFFERAEVKDILSYLSFFHNPYDTEALERIINAPKRGIGEVTLQRIQKLCHERKAEAIDILKAICGITKPSEPCDVVISAAAKNGLKRLLNLCTEVQTMLKEKQTIADIIKHIVSSLEYEQYLKLSYKQDWESRWENIGELVTVAKSFASGRLANDSSTDTSDLLVQFLESTTLDVDRKEHEEASEGKVTIATMHTAKGLEWPVVFVVGCEEGIVPHQKADTKEESRLLYVAMTRPRCFLYCTYARVRTVWGNTKASDLTRFLSNLSPDFYQERTPPWDAKVRTWVAGLLNRPLPEESGNLEHPGDYYPVLSEDNNSDEDSYSSYNSYSASSQQFSSFGSPKLLLQEDSNRKYNRTASSTNVPNKRIKQENYFPNTPIKREGQSQPIKQEYFSGGFSSPRNLPKSSAKSYRKNWSGRKPVKKEEPSEVPLNDFVRGIVRKHCRGSGMFTKSQITQMVQNDCHNRNRATSSDAAVEAMNQEIQQLVQNGVLAQFKTENDDVKYAVIDT